MEVGGKTLSPKGTLGQKALKTTKTNNKNRKPKTQKELVVKNKRKKTTPKNTSHLLQDISAEAAPPPPAASFTAPRQEPGRIGAGQRGSNKGYDVSKEASMNS